jgi:hypothetical protein
LTPEQTKQLKEIRERVGCHTKLLAEQATVPAGSFNEYLRHMKAQLGRMVEDGDDE